MNRTMWCHGGESCLPCYRSGYSQLGQTGVEKLTFSIAGRVSPAILSRCRQGSLRQVVDFGRHCYLIKLAWGGSFGTNRLQPMRSRDECLFAGRSQIRHLAAGRRRASAQRNSAGSAFNLKAMANSHTHPDHIVNVPPRCFPTHMR